MISYTLWPSLYAVDEPYPVTESWSSFVERFSTHAEHAVKDQAPGFGPYVLTEPSGPCPRHRKAGVHRCDSLVSGVTLAVFDVDYHATEESITATDAFLATAGIARLWYSSYSFPETLSFRLILPVSRPITEKEWRPLRDRLIQTFHVSADPRKCSGLSHFYYGPTARPGVAGVVSVGAGEPLDVDAFVRDLPPAKDFRGDLDDYYDDAHDPENDPTAGVDVAAPRERLSKTATRWGRSADPRVKEKAELLRRLVSGEALATKGSRNDTTFRLAGVVAHELHDVPLVALEAIFRPSVEAMMVAGSSLTPATVRWFLVSSLRTARAKAARDEALKKNFGRWGSEAKAAAASKRLGT